MNREKTGNEGGEDFEMLDESQNKNGSQAQNFADEIVKNLSELMTNFIAVYKQIEQKK